MNDYTRGLIIDLIPVALVAAALVAGAALAPNAVNAVRRMGRAEPPPPYDLADLAADLEIRRHREGVTVVHRHVDLPAVRGDGPITLAPITITARAPKIVSRSEARVWTCDEPRTLTMGSGTVRECRWTVLP